MLDETRARDALALAASDVAVGPVPTEQILIRGRRSRNRHRALTAAAAAILVVVSVGGGASVIGALQDRTSQGGLAAPPLAADAAPEDVVRAYVTALNQRDADAARALMTATHFERSQAAKGGLFSEGRLQNLRLGAPNYEYARGAGGTSADGYAESVFVPATYDVDSDQAIWGYLLVRNSPQDQWTIADEGPV